MSLGKALLWIGFAAIAALYAVDRFGLPSNLLYGLCGAVVVIGILLIWQREEDG